MVYQAKKKTEEPAPATQETSIEQPKAQAAQEKSNVNSAELDRQLAEMQEKMNQMKRDMAKAK